MFHTAVSPVGLTRTLSHTRLGVRCVVAGEAGFLRADCLRLPSGHAHLDVWVIRATGEADVLTHRATTPLREAWDRGGAEPLFDALEAEYAKVLAPTCGLCGRAKPLAPGRSICADCAYFPLD